MGGGGSISLTPTSYGAKLRGGVAGEVGFRGP